MLLAFAPLDSATLDSATTAYRIAIAIGIGLLIGIERERRKAAVTGATEGIRTFALTALAGALAGVIGSDLVMLMGGGVVGALLIVVYARSGSGGGGITTEVAVLVTYLLGIVAIYSPALAASSGVAAAMLLAFREQIHAFVRSTLAEAEVRDALVFASAALVIWPLLPNRALDPFEVVNPAAIWRIVVLFMAISAAGYVAVRFFGPRAGLPVAGFFAGFVSSASATASMAGIVRAQPKLLAGAVGGAVLANVATLAFLIALVAATSTAALRALAVPVGLAIGAVTIYAAIVAARSLRQGSDEPPKMGHAFDLRAAISFALALTAIELVAAVVNNQFGASGLIIASALAGFADTHAVAVGAAALVAAHTATPSDAALAVVAAITTNQITKATLAFSLARGRFSILVTGGLVLMVGGSWLGLATGIVP
jgi:uncharacterized membrane protein (DUF4010 family)